jgi:hypothetical protein
MDIIKFVYLLITNIMTDNIIEDNTLPFDDILSTLLPLFIKSSSQSPLDNKLNPEFFEHLIDQIAPVVIKAIFEAKPNFKNLVKKIIEEMESAESITIDKKGRAVVESNKVFERSVVDFDMGLCDHISGKRCWDSKKQHVPIVLQDVYTYCFKRPSVFPEIKNSAWTEMIATLKYVAWQRDIAAYNFLCGL